MNAIDEKIKAFTPLECVEKAIEEATELLDALLNLNSSIRSGVSNYEKDWEVFVAKEFADVEVSVKMTLIEKNPVMQAAYEAKLHRAITHQIPDAIQAKIRDNMAERSENLGEGMTDGEYDAMAGNVGGLF